MTVVLCASLGATGAMWEGIDGVCVDHPGHGAAPVVEVRSVEGLAARVLEEVDGRFTFVGLSLGGAIGLQLALDAPERLERLVVCCTSPRFGTEEQWRARAELVRRQGLEPIVDTIMERWFSPAFAHMQRFRDMFLSVDPEGYARCCEALATWDVRDRLGGVRVPVLAVAGESDPTSPPADLEAIARATGGRLEVLPGRHLAPVESADAFAEALR